MNAKDSYMKAQPRGVKEILLFINLQNSVSVRTY